MNYLMMIYCSKGGKNMIEILSEFSEMRDDNAIITGYINFKSISLYEKKDLMVCNEKIYPKAPCLVMEILDEENSTAEHKYMKPIAWVPVNKKQIEFFKKYFDKMELEDEQQSMV